MIQAASEAEVDLTSPIRVNSKHKMTPLRSKHKTSRKDRGTDVHTTSSTPERLQSGIQCSSFSSPDAFLYSQENRPDVIWDYTSPKLPKGAKKREIKITVDEFLKSLSHNSHPQVPECNTQRSQYIKLLEKWMAKQNTPVCVKKPVKHVKRDSKMRSRRIFEEIKEFIGSIEQTKEEKPEESDGKEGANEKSSPKAESPNQSISSVNKKSFLEGDNNENDSIEELWGEADNSFMVKATQHLDVSSFRDTSQNKNVEITSTIPETIPGTHTALKYTEIEQSTDENCHNKAILDSDLQAQILLTQIMNYDWNSDSGNEDLENGFIMEDEALSLIPDEVLCGTDTQDNKNISVGENVIGKLCNNEILNENLINSNCEENKQIPENRSCELSFSSSDMDKITFQAVNQSEIELFNNFEDESFGDESLLCKPEVLSWIDEVESKLSQSQKSTPEEILSQSQICTPQEIEKKKDEAIQRRKRNQSRSGNL